MSALAEALIAAQAELPTALKRGGPMRDRLLLSDLDDLIEALQEARDNG